MTLSGPRRQGGSTTSTFGGTFAAALLSAIAQSHRIMWPSPVYRDDPVRFFREILSVDPWDRQIEVIEAVRDHDRVAVSGGRKVSKSCNIGGLALWWYASFDAAQVILTSAGARQINAILWRELKMMFARSGRCLECVLAMQADSKKRIPRPCQHSQVLDGNMHELAQSGLKSNDFREITGFSANDPVAAQGVSGQHLLYLTDESTGIDDAIFHAIIGNMAGGGKLAMFSNPTKCDGFFFDAFDKKETNGWKCITVSSTDSPNVRAGKTVIRGLATREYIENAKRDWGEDSPLYIVHVLGRFAAKEEGKVISLHLIAQSQRDWADAAADTEYRDEGRLFIGVDPAGDSGLGDESAFAARRGQRVFLLETERGLSAEAHLVRVLHLISSNKRPRELPPVVVLDREGKVGFDVYCKFLEYLQKNEGAFILVPFRGSDAPRQPDIYGTQRDEAWSDCSQWIRNGGMIPPSGKLTKELHAPSWFFGQKGRQKVTPKEDLRKMLGRSPDSADAVILSCWEATPIALGIVEEPSQQDAPTTEDIQRSDPYSWERTMDPYGGLRAFESR
jgi:phage terminase large subunit